MTFFGARRRQASRRSSSISPHGGFLSSQAPIQPYAPTYAGLKYLSGRERMTRSCSTLIE